MAALAVGGALVIVPPALLDGATASAVACPKSGCGWTPEQWEAWRGNNPNTARFLSFVDWLAFAASLSPAGPLPARTFGRAFGTVGVSSTPATSPRPVRAFPGLENVSARALGEVNEAVNLLDEAIAEQGLTGDEAQPEVDIANKDAKALAELLRSVSGNDLPVPGDAAEQVAAEISARIQQAADDLLSEAVAIADASVEGPAPTYAEIGSFDGDATAMNAASRDAWNTSWRDEVMAEVGSDSGQLGKNNKAIKRLLDPNGKIGSVPGAAEEYTRLVGEFAESLANPAKPAADAMVKFDNLQKEFSAPNQQGKEMTYLPKGNLDNVREAIAAKRMFEAGIVDFKPGEPVSGLTPDYVALDGTFLGDAVRMSGQRTADAFKSGIKAKISEKIGVYATRTGKPVRVVIDASDNPALGSAGLTDFQSLVSDGVKSVPAGDLTKLKDVVVLGPNGMLVQAEPSGNILKTAQSIRVRRSVGEDPPILTGWLVDQHSGKCVAPSSARTFAPWTLQTCSLASAQQKVSLTISGQLRAFDKEAAVCAAPNGSGSGAPVWSRSCVTSSPQTGLTWTVDTTGHLTNRRTNLVLDVHKEGTADGTPVTTYKSRNESRDSNQNFDFITRITDQPKPLINPETEKCLTVPDSGAQLVMKACDESARQQFSYNSANQHIEINTGSGPRCLYAGWISGSAPVMLSSCDRSDASKWNFNADGTISTWSVTQSRTGCLDITGDSHQDGAKVGWYDCHPTYHNQRFTQVNLDAIVLAQSISSMATRTS